MVRILITEEIAEAGLQKLRAAGHSVDIKIAQPAEDLERLILGAAGLIVRSATQVTAALLQAGSELVVVGRAGVGLDNVDVQAATKRGILVVNAPESNIISTAEQTMALILAQARHTAQADASLRAGRWERSKLLGMELHGKTLGIVGLGRVGSLVAERAAAFGMRLIAHDPYVGADRGAEIGVGMVSLEDLAESSDIVTVHVTKGPETIGMIGARFLAMSKRGVRIVNVSRGGVVDEEALNAALLSGQVGGAGLDVFAVEPPAGSPLLSHPNVVVTPHLGAATHEAQERAGVTIAEEVGAALSGDPVRFAVNSKPDS